MTLAAAVSWLATVATVAMFASPLSIVREVAAAGALQGRPVAQFYGMLLNCTLWSLYGVVIGDPAVIACNGAGEAVAVLSLVVMHRYGTAEEKQRVVRVAGTILGGALSLAGAAVAVLPHPQTTTLLGLCAACGSLAFFGAPLLQLREMCQARSASAITPVVLLWSFLCSSLWSVYATMIGDAFMFVPNACGLALCVAQCGLLALFGRESVSIKPL